MDSATRTPARRPLMALLALYAMASLWHFTHNAEYIALYPHMPAWLTREKVYLAWLAVSAVGLLGAGMWLAGRRKAAGVAIALYGLLGLGGLAHYSLALCSEHTLAMNFTIWFEALAGLALAAGVTWHLSGHGPVRKEKAS